MKISIMVRSWEAEQGSHSTMAAQAWRPQHRTSPSASLHAAKSKQPAADPKGIQTPPSSCQKLEDKSPNCARESWKLPQQLPAGSQLQVMHITCLSSPTSDCPSWYQICCSFTSLLSLVGHRTEAMPPLIARCVKQRHTHISPESIS